jgi:hypothetical protein
MQPPILIETLVDDVTNATRARYLENDRVNERNVIGEEQKSSGGKILSTNTGNSVEQSTDP